MHPYIRVRPAFAAGPGRPEPVRGDPVSWAHDRPGRSVCRMVTFTPAEWERARLFYGRVRAAKGGRLPFTAHARELLVNGRTIVVQMPVDARAAGMHMGRIGSNVNQIARVANTTGTLSAAQVDALLADLAELRALFVQLRRRCDELLDRSR